LVPSVPVPALLTDGSGIPVAVTPRNALSAEPAWLNVRPEASRRVVSWAGPWPADERWWDPHGDGIRVRFQVATVDGSGWLLLLEEGRWWVEAIYD
jgi:protein ImuB